MFFMYFLRWQSKTPPPKRSDSLVGHKSSTLNFLPSEVPIQLTIWVRPCGTICVCVCILNIHHHDHSAMNFPAKQGVVGTIVIQRWAFCQARWQEHTKHWNFEFSDEPLPKRGENTIIYSWPFSDELFCQARREVQNFNSAMSFLPSEVTSTYKTY